MFHCWISLLDRIHRVKFDNLNVKDKIVITHNYILPEIFEKINLKGQFCLKMTLLNILLKHTCESGVRKLRDIL